MELFIKDGKSFVTKTHALILDYEIKPSIYDTVSTFVVPYNAQIESGDIVYDEATKFIGVVSAVNKENEILTVSANQIQTLFARKMFYSAASYTYLEDFLKSLIDANYTNCADTWYALPYLSVTAYSHTSGAILPDFDDLAVGGGDIPASVTGTTLTLDQMTTLGRTYSVKSYMAKLRRLERIFCDYDISNTTLAIKITKKAKTTKNVDFSNPSFKLIEQNFSELKVTKITSFCTENANTQNWVLLDDGSVVNTTPQLGRVSGEWTPLVVESAADVANSVNDEFTKNYYAHNITFWCPISYEFNLYDDLQVKLDNKLYTSYVAQKRIWKDSQVQEVQCGELQTQYPYMDLI